MLKEERQLQIANGIKRARSQSSMGSNILTASGKSGLSGSDANSMATSQNEDNNADHDDDDIYDDKDKTGNEEIIKTIDDIF